MIGATRFRVTAEINRQSRLASDISRAQTDISSEKRLQTASDDPSASARVGDIRRKQANEAAWAANADTAAAVANTADSSLKLVSTGLDRARELMIAGSSATASAADRASYATELRGIVADFESYSKQTDSRGIAIFPEDMPIAIPIGRGISLSATTTKAEAFGNVPTANGPTDLATILNAAAAAIEMPDGAARTAAVNASVTDIASATSHVADVHAGQGLRAAQFDAASTRLADSKVTLQEERDSLEGTDIPATVARLQSKLVTLEAAQAAFARISKQTLFDLLG
ncbi:flagellin [Sphingomonas solaris]|uniref:Flagellin n=1 Tax=Alterirhizorhabdus solaris TaxID=2529389 RepID=A0A558QUU7_9SPHN|nr:flagellin [Sphingomonas solaris]TVV70930.1 flagellin-like protein [Sphingomonas solaris]